MTWQDAAGMLDTVVLGNPLRAYLTAAGAFLVALAALFAVRTVVLSRLKALAERTETDFDDFLVSLIGQIRNPEYQFVAFYVATRSLSMSGAIEKIIQVAFVVVVAFRAVRLLQAMVAYGVAKLTATEGVAASTALRSITFVTDLLLWAGGVLFVLDNLGVNITAMVAGLGIGGIAVALAAQAVLGDLFSSLTIHLDQPFVVGDFIVAGDHKGTVEHIGVKTTRVRSLDGELLVFPNSDLTGSRIRNFQKMQRRRCVFGFGVVYETPAAVLRRIPELTAAIVKGAGKTTLDRVHLRTLGASSLDFEVVYFLDTPDYNVYMDVQQRINFELLERFEKEGIGFAYPTQTLYVRKTEAAAA